MSKRIILLVAVAIQLPPRAARAADVGPGAFGPPDPIELHHRCATGWSSDPCWASVVDVTAAHVEETRGARRSAADLRAASPAYAAVEASECLGLGDDDRDIDPLTRSEDIAATSPIAKKGDPSQVLGAVVAFRAVASLTEERLQRIVDCHLAKRVALQGDRPDLATGPTLPPDVVARVVPAGAGLSVELRGRDVQEGAEILAMVRSEAR